MKIKIEMNIYEKVLIARSAFFTAIVCIFMWSGFTTMALYGDFFFFNDFRVLAGCLGSIVSGLLFCSIYTRFEDYLRCETAQKEGDKEE